MPATAAVQRAPVRQILVLSADDALWNEVSRRLRGTDHILRATSIEEANLLFRDKTPDIILLDSQCTWKSDGIGAVLGLAEKMARVGEAFGGGAGHVGHRGFDLGANAHAIARAPERITSAQALLLRGHAGEPQNHARFRTRMRYDNVAGQKRRVTADVSNSETEMCCGHSLTGLIE